MGGEAGGVELRAKGMLLLYLLFSPSFCLFVYRSIHNIPPMLGKHFIGCWVTLWNQLARCFSSLRSSHHLSGLLPHTWDPEGQRLSQPSQNKDYCTEKPKYPPTTGLPKVVTHLLILGCSHYHPVSVEFCYFFKTCLKCNVSLDKSICSFSASTFLSVKW